MEHFGDIHHHDFAHTDWQPHDTYAHAGTHNASDHHYSHPFSSFNGYTVGAAVAASLAEPGQIEVAHPQAARLAGLEEHAITVKDPSVQAALQHAHEAKDRAAEAHEHQQQAQQQAEDAKQQAEQKKQAVTAATATVAAVGAAIAIAAAIPVLGEIAEAALVPAEAAAVAAEAAAEAAVVAATEVVATAAEVAADVGAEVAAADLAVEVAADGLAEAIEAADALPTAALEEAGVPEAEAEAVQAAEAEAVQARPPEVQDVYERAINRGEPPEAIYKQHQTGTLNQGGDWGEEDLYMGRYDAEGRVQIHIHESANGDVTGHIKMGNDRWGLADQESRQLLDKWGKEVLPREQTTTGPDANRVIPWRDVTRSSAMQPDHSRSMLGADGSMPHWENGLFQVSEKGFLG